MTTFSFFRVARVEGPHRSDFADLACSRHTSACIGKQWITSVRDGHSPRRSVGLVKSRAVVVDLGLVCLNGTFSELLTRHTRFACHQTLHHVSFRGVFIVTDSDDVWSIVQKLAVRSILARVVFGECRRRSGHVGRHRGCHGRVVVLGDGMVFAELLFIAFHPLDHLKGRVLAEVRSRGRKTRGWDRRRRSIR